MERLITQIIDNKTIMKTEREIYNMQAIYVGYIAKRLVETVDGESKVRRLVNASPIMLKYSDGYGIDIENGNKYPILNLGEIPQNDDYYIPERLMYDYSTFCCEAIYSAEIAQNLEMTPVQLRKILNEQERRQQIYFNW